MKTTNKHEEKSIISLLGEVSQLCDTIVPNKGLTPTQERERAYQAAVIDRLMHLKYIPFLTSRGLIEEFQGVVKWCFLFNNSPEMCAGQIWQRVMSCQDDIEWDEPFNLTQRVVL